MLGRSRQCFAMCTRRQFRSLVAVSFSLAALGCGVEAYQERMLQNTVPLFNYKQELESSLGPEWRKGEVRLRLPSWFSEVPAPKKNEPDKRLPPGLDAEFVGLLGGFRGKVEAVTSDGKTVETPVYAMVLSNRVLLASRDPKVKPSKFAQQFLAELSRAVGGGKFLSDKSLSRVSVGGKSFQPNLRYDWGTLETTSGAVPMEYRVYIHDAPPLQVAVVFLVPKEAARSERLSDRIDLSLQTLRADSSNASSATPSPATPNSPSF